MEIKVYTGPGCGKCIALKSILMDAKIEFTEVSDFGEVSDKASEEGIFSLPLISIDNVVYGGITALAKGKELTENV